MMDNWARKEKGSGNYSSRGVWRQRSSTSRRPPLAGQRSVPSWEKKFCALVGSVPWQKLLEAKKFMHLYENVVRWNDAAGEEAFKNAKSRFWAEINGLPCNIKPPDPDIYIDKVDWDANIDPELLLDLEREPDINAGKAEGDIVILGKPSVLDSQPFLCDDGWGNLEEASTAGGAKQQGWRNWNEIDNACTCNDGADEGPKGGNNWDDGNNVAGGWSDPWQGSGNWSGSNEYTGDGYGDQGGRWSQNNGRTAMGSNSWDRDHWSFEKNVASDRSGRPASARNSSWRRKDRGGGGGGGPYGDRVRASGQSYRTANWDDYRLNRGWKSGKERRRQEVSYEQLRWVDRKGSQGRW